MPGFGIFKNIELMDALHPALKPRVFRNADGLATWIPDGLSIRPQAEVRSCFIFV
jgi:hypothetical protein